MSHLTLRHSLIVAAHAIVGWALCAATMGLGIAATGLHSALIIHAVAAPIIFTNISALLALGVAAVWAIYGGVYFTRSSKASGRTILIESRGAGA